MGVYEVGPTVQVAERVVNLSGEGPFSVLQVTIVLEFAAAEEDPDAQPEDILANVEKLKADVALVSALIEDGVNALISTKSGEGLLTVAGKDELKQEIMEVANKFAPHPVIAVYFTKFFLQ
jgi:flagellar basal body-associated protein FliL